MTLPERSSTFPRWSYRTLPLLLLSLPIMVGSVLWIATAVDLWAWMALGVAVAVSVSGVPHRRDCHLRIGTSRGPQLRHRRYCRTPSAPSSHREPPRPPHISNVSSS